MNEITIHGNLTDKPELHFTSEAKAVLNFSVAVNRRRLDRQSGQWVDQAPVFHRVVAFGALAENAANLDRGAAVTVTGEFVDKSWLPEGETKRVYRIELMAADIAASLRFATVEITKNAKRETVAATG
jgi:single-strand DNA-binding protein